jgi:SAM-dependent methyltransferase
MLFSFQPKFRDEEPAPLHNHDVGYSFEYPVRVPGGTSTNFLDLYRRAHFVLESKQFTTQKLEQSALEAAAIEAGAITGAKRSGPVRGTGSWDDAMIRAKGQAERYVRSLPAEEPNPPFILVCDVGHSIEVYADFTQAGKAYLPFPDPRTFRIQLKDLEREDIRERLRLIWTNPAALDPAKVSAEVTREIAGYLAELAKSLEQEKHDPEVVAQFLTRCLFCMFAEDVGLIPDHAFTELLNSVPADGTGFPELLSTLFREMNTGTGKSISVVLRKKLLQFNGGLFKDDTVLPVNGLQLGLIKQAASKQWKNVEPAIFGTLLERALVPEERHALGAHFTPRAYVERLVLPTVIDPLREEWENVRAAAITHANKSDLKKARQEINAFHDQLCRLRVLDPACGSGNFLYVALQQMKILEGEVLDFAAQFGEDMKLELETHTIDPHQFLGIELNPRAASIAELVLWIGYLQWHFKIHGQRTPPEPILRAFKNIECRDAVLAYDGAPQPVLDENGNVITVWDRRSTKTDLVTNRDVPDETKRVPLLTYVNPRPAAWPEADFIVGNPPFLGTARMRDDLGDAYAETLRAAYPEMPESADFVLYWWHKAATLVRGGQARRFGLITTNSLRQTFARRVVQMHLGNVVPPLGGSDKDRLKPGLQYEALSLAFAIPDHPWVDTAEGAAVRIAMTVGVAGWSEGVLSEVVDEEEHEDGAANVTLRSRHGKIAADLTVGADVTSAMPLKANEEVVSRGVQTIGEGFVVSRDQAEAWIKVEQNCAHYLRPYLNGKDMTSNARDVFVIDFFGNSQVEALKNASTLYQHLLVTVKPERDQSRRDSYRQNWWILGEPQPALRRMTAGLLRYIASPVTAKHRFFQFLGQEVLADQALNVFAFDDAYYLGVLSSRIHVVFALVAGGRLGVGNDPRYNNSKCFAPFPFPLCGEAEKARIRAVAEELDAHRKRVQAQHPGLTLTGMYNVLEKLRSTVVPPLGGALESPDPPKGGTTVPNPAALTDKERLIHDQGLVSLLKQLHDDLDAAVCAAYGWPATLTDAEILQRLVTLNAQRAEEEKRGIIHWLRPEYQNAAGKVATQDTLGLTEKKGGKVRGKKLEVKGQKAGTKTAWPKPLAERIRATEQVLHAAGHAVTAEELTTHFSRAKAADLQEILESLVTLGRARRDGERFSV